MRLWLLLPALLFSCAPESVDRYHTGESEEEILSLLNERQYAKAVWLIEHREGKNPEGRIAFLLGQAYLGKSGIEPLEFAARLSGPEPQKPEASRLFPDCPKDAIRSVSSVKMRCLLKRVYLHAPDADQPDFKKARLHFRRAYPNPAQAPEWVNVLIGMAETIALAQRAGSLFLYAKGVGATELTFNMADIPWLKSQGASSLEEAREALARANHSGEKISRFLSDTKANAWFERVEGTVAYAKEVGLPRFLDFVRENLLQPTDEIKYGESLDRLRGILEVLEN